MYLMPLLKAFLSEFCNGAGAQKKLEWHHYQTVKKLWRCVHSFNTQYRHWTDGEMDGFVIKNIALCMHHVLMSDKNQTHNSARQRVLSHILELCNKLLLTTVNRAQRLSVYFTDLHIRRSAFISYQQQVALIVNNHFLLETTTCNKVPPNSWLHQFYRSKRSHASHDGWNKKLSWCWQRARRI